MSRAYPDNYVGPKAGKSMDEEWLAVRPIQAMRWILDGTWTYCDFDCYVHARCEEAYQLGYKEGKESIKKK